MAGRSRDVAHAFEEEVFFRIRAQRALLAWISVTSLILASLSVGALIAVLPLKEVRPYVLIVDRTTGETERVVQVSPANLAEREAIRQAELVSYVIDRETYDIADNPTRIPEVLNRSSAQAAQSLRTLWTASNKDYPPSLYGSDFLITVQVKSVTLLDDGTAQVRFTRKWERAGDRPVLRAFVATIGFEFNPRIERNLEAVWENPLGFTVVSYRIDAETLDRQEN